MAVRTHLGCSILVATDAEAAQYKAEHMTVQKTAPNDWDSTIKKNGFNLP